MRACRVCWVESLLCRSVTPCRCAQRVAAPHPFRFLAPSLAQNWGKTRMMPLSELNRSDRSYLAGDRLAVRVSIRVLPPSGGAAAAAIVQAPPAAVPGFA